MEMSEIETGHRSNHYVIHLLKRQNKWLKVWIHIFSQKGASMLHCRTFSILSILYHVYSGIYMYIITP